MTLSNNPLLNVTATASVEAVGGDRDGSLGTAGINVPPQRGGEAVPTTGVTVTLGPGAVSVVAAASQWSLMGGGYGYPNGTSTQGSAGTDEEGGR